MLLTPHLSRVKEARPPRLVLEGVRRAFGIMRTVSRVAKDAATPGSATLRVLDATYRYVIKRTLPDADGGVSPEEETRGTEGSIAARKI